MLHTDILVIGGGLSGITFAHFAAKLGKKVIILEKRSLPGGCIRTTKPYDDNDFFIELGAHTIYSSYSAILEMIDNLGLKRSVIPHLKHGYFMYEKNQIASIFSKLSIVGLLSAAFHFPFCKKAGLTVKEYYTKTVGAKNYENIIHPLTSAVICQDSADFAADVILKSRKKNRSYPRSFSLPNGLQSLLERAASQKMIALHTKTVISSIEYKKGKHIISATDGEYAADKIAFAADAYNSAELISRWRNASDRVKKVAELLRELPMKKSEAFAVSARTEQFKIRRFSYIISKNSPLRSVVSRDVIENSKYRGATFHFKPETSLTDYPKTACEILGIDEYLSSETARFTLPELRVTHKDWRRKVEALANVKNFYLLGNYFGGLSLEDCALRAKSEAERAAEE